MNRRDFLKDALTLAALAPIAKLHAKAGAGGVGLPGTTSGDLLFTNVELYDGTGRPPFPADVAVRGDKIVEVAGSGSLKRTGCVVIDGALGTDSVTTSEMTSPRSFLTMQRYCRP